MAAVSVRSAGLQARCCKIQSASLAQPAQQRLCLLSPGQAAPRPCGNVRSGCRSQMQASKLPATSPFNKLQEHLRWRVRAASMTAEDREVQRSVETPNQGGFRLNAVAWLPILLMAMAEAHHGETNIGEIFVDPSRDFYTTWHLSEEFIKHFYIAFICVFSFGCVFFGSLKDPFYEGTESGYREDGGNGTAHWFYAVKEEDEVLAREALAKEVMARDRAEKEEVMRQLEEQIATETEKASTGSPKEPSLL